MTAREDQFCIEFARGDCPHRTAAIRAGYSAKSAAQQAARLLTKAHIKARIAELRAKVERAAVADLQEVCEGLTSIFRGDLPDYIPYLGKPQDLAEAPNTKALHSIDLNDDGTISKIRLKDPIPAAKELGRYLGWDDGPPPDPAAEAKAIDDFITQARAATGLPPQDATLPPTEGHTP